jgi:hypothetical protein
MTVTFPNNEFNAAVKDGSIGEKIGRILEKQKPETAYFTEQNGERAGVMAVQMSNPSEIPSFAEPWFVTFNAKVEFRVAMTPEELQRADLERLGKQLAQ